MLNLYSGLLTVHVMAGTALMASSLASPVVRRTVRSAESGSAMLPALRVARHIAVYNPILALIVLGTGAYLGSHGWWQQGWFAVALGLWLVNAVYCARTVKGFEERLGVAAAESGSSVGSQLDGLRWSASFDTAADVLIANDLATLALMVVKPDLLWSLLVILAFNTVVLVVGAARRSSMVRAAG